MEIKRINEKGFTTVDIGIAMIVVILFVTIMSSMLYSVYISSTEAKRTATGLNYAVDIFEEIAQESYSTVNAKEVLTNLDNVNITEVVSTTTNDIEVATGKIGTYNIKLEMTKPYSDGTIKKFKLIITYPISKKNTETMEFERIKTISKA